MSERVTMPALGESVTEGTVTRWLKAVGDSVEVDEPLLEVSTDKVDTEIPSPVAGVLQEILVGEDDTVPVGADLAVIGDGAASSQEDSGDESSSQAEPETSEASADSHDGDAIEDPSNSAEVAEAGDEGGQEPATPHTDDAADPAPSDSAPSQGSAGGASDSGGEGGSTVTMPALGESVTEGTVTRWLKSVGDEVEVDEALLEVSTDKVDTEIPSPVAGTLTKILVQEDETVPVGSDLAVIGGSDNSGSDNSGSGNSSDADSSGAESSGADSGDAKTDETSGDQEQPQQQEQPEAPSTEAPAPGEPKAEESKPQGQAQPQPKADSDSASGSDSGATSQTAAQPAAAKTDSSASEASSTSDAAAYVTPLVRKLASDAGIDLAALTGTGIGGRIRKQDVVAAIEAQKAPKESAPQTDSSPSASSASAPSSASTSAKSSSEGLRGSTQKMSRLRKMIATRMVESLQTSAQLTTVVEVDVTKVARLRDRVKSDFAAREGTKLSFLPFFALAAVEALKAYPSVNASIDGDSVVYHGAENLGVAVDTDKGLIVPVVKHAGDLNIAGLARAIADVADRTRNNKITPDDLSGGTFTITNTGSRGALFDTPIINQPQVAILGTGSVVKRAVVVTDADGGETIAIRSMVYLALTYDHRIVDGADAARFLTAVKERLEEGTFEV